MPPDAAKPGPVPVEAIAWLKGKGIKPAASWKDTWGQEHRYAFYVAKIVEHDVLKDVQASLEDGVPFDEWCKAVALARLAKADLLAEGKANMNEPNVVELRPKAS